MSSDLINGLFEFVGSIMVWGNYVRVLRDKGYAGLHPATTTFFTSWGIWNLFYYPHLGQLWSFVGGVSLVIANCFWLGACLVFGRKR